MNVTLVKGVFVAECPFAEKDMAKNAGFRWDKIVAHRWATTDISVASRLAQYAQGDVAALLQAEADRLAQAVEQSRATDAVVDIQAPAGQEYMPFQRAGIAWGLSHHAALIGDEMGLGKTIQAIGVINGDQTIERVLVICPATLKLNWKNELEKWLVRPLTVGIANSNNWPATKVVVVNYDVIDKMRLFIDREQWDLLLVDEAHYLKNPKAKRTRAVVGGDAQPRKGVAAQPGITARRKLFLTGTPIENRPVELWPLLHYLDPQRWCNFFQFAIRYCDAHQDRYGWTFSGSSNLAELQTALRETIMVRRLKSAVLTELPAKRRQIVEIDANGAGQAVKRETAAWTAHEDEVLGARAAVELAKADNDDDSYRAAVARLRDTISVAFTAMAHMRHETAIAKIPAVIEHLRDAIEEGKVVVFAHHIDVLDAIVAAFPGQAVKVDGSVSLDSRQRAVDRFQGDPAVRLFVGQLRAAGVGITLTAASHVVFAELDWVPGTITQAEDRVHRIGQAESVLIQHLVFGGSLDARMARVLVEKQNVIDRALDAEATDLNTEPLVPILQNGEPSESRDQIARLAARMTPDAVAAIHRGLRILAGMDADHASVLNGVGFARIDVQIGHSLAEQSQLTAKQAALGMRLIRKYRRQLPAEICVAVPGLDKREAPRYDGAVGTKGEANDGRE